MKKLNFTGNFYGEKITISQVQKRTAKKMFDAGETIYLQSSNYHPFGAWSKCIEIGNKTGKTFEFLVNNFEFYNCNSETGYYTTFYKRVN